jgi:hypothetical protein
LRDSLKTDLPPKELPFISANNPPFRGYISPWDERPGRHPKNEETLKVAKPKIDLTLAIECGELHDENPALHNGCSLLLQDTQVIEDRIYAFDPYWNEEG